LFNVNLYREPHGLQDSIEVEVLKQEDERFLKRNRIQVDMIDKIFEVVLLARLDDGREFSVQKGTMSVRDAFSALVASCRELVNKPVLVH
jgi:hypothetical protein